jgi:hypothetical protein
VAYFVSDEPERALKQQAQTNQHAFCAKLSTHSDVAELDQIGRAGFAFRSTCEFAPWELTHFPDIEDWYDPDDDPADFDWPARRDLELERVSIKMLNAKIPAAAQWLKYVGKRLAKREAECQVDRTEGIFEREVCILAREVRVDDQGNGIGEGDAEVGEGVCGQDERDRE